jgi:hypothetical protein
MSWGAKSSFKPMEITKMKGMPIPFSARTNNTSKLPKKHLLNADSETKIVFPPHFHHGEKKVGKVGTLVHSSTRYQLVLNLALALSWV